MSKEKGKQQSEAGGKRIPGDIDEAGEGGGWLPATVGKIQRFKVADFKQILCPTSRNSSRVKNGSESDAIRRPRVASFSMTSIDVMRGPRVKVTTRENEMEVRVTISLAIVNAWRGTGLLTLGLARLLFLSALMETTTTHYLLTSLSDRVPIFLFIYLLKFRRSR